MSDGRLLRRLEWGVSPAQQQEMKMRILKWTLAITDLQTLELPQGAGILTVQMQGDMPQLWALCNEATERKDKRHIAIYGTGNPMPDEPGDYIATFQMHGGTLVFHAFEVEDEQEG